MRIPFIKQSLDQNTFQILYYRNKMYLLPVSFFLLALILAFFAVAPQVKDYFVLKDEEKNMADKIITIKNNVAVLSSIKEEELDKKLQIATVALPVEKDFGGILRAIGQAAIDANVALGDFSFQIGSLSPGASKIAGALPIEISLTVNDGIEGGRRFLLELSKRLPLSETTSFKVNQSSTSMTVIFYYKSIAGINFNPSQKIEALSNDQSFLLEELYSFFNK